MGAMTWTPLEDSACQLGESPFWHPHEHRLYWLDIPGRAVLRATRVPVEWDGAAWREGEIVCARVMVGGQQVLGGRSEPIAAPAGGSVVDAEARAAIAAMVRALRGHGLID